MRMNDGDMKFDMKAYQHSPSLDMPTAMHFLSLQYWHRFLLMRRIEHCWFLVQGRYWIFCWMLRRKNPWKEIKKNVRPFLVLFRGRMVLFFIFYVLGKLFFFFIP